MMGYYDNIKDSVKDQDSRDSSTNFETLREAAENTPDDEERSDDTDIEVLEDGISTGSSGKTQKDSKSSGGSKNVGKGSSGVKELSGSGEGNRERKVAGGQSGDVGKKEISRPEGVEAKLDRIIEQNQRMIEILEGFSN